MVLTRTLGILTLVGVTLPTIARAQQQRTDGTTDDSTLGAPALPVAPSPPAAPVDATSTASAVPASASSAPPPNALPPAPAPAVDPGLLTRLLNALDRFSFGSYGRVVAASDLRGHSGRDANIVSHGSRLDESTYAELELHRDDDFGPVHTRVVATLGIMGPLFGESGDFTTTLAVRNLYVEERGAIARPLTLWVGARMYRGDDIYLLDWWPLDNLNTVGGGARYDFGNYVTVAAHVGMNRLDTNYTQQTIPVIPREGVGATSLLLLDRPRVIGSLKGTWWLNGRAAPSGIKVSLYGEVHQMSSGVRQNADSGQFELLPSDSGYVAGAQVGWYGGERNTFVNLFFRYGQGLGAYGDLAVPTLQTAGQTSARARDVVLAATGNWEHGAFGLMGAAYIRYFHDADGSLYGLNERYEGIVMLRPTVWLGEWFGISAEGSYQAIQFNMVDPVSGTGPAGGSLWRFGLIPFVSPAGRGNFTRPHLRLIYALTVRDAGAQHLYAADDAFSRNNLEHFLGIGCEWWFNSSYR